MAMRPGSHADSTDAWGNSISGHDGNKIHEGPETIKRPASGVPCAPPFLPIIIVAAAHTLKRQSNC